MTIKHLVNSRCFFEYGKLVNTIDEEYQLSNYDPFERLMEVENE